MTLVLRLDAIEQLPQTPATDVKRLGWRGVMKSVSRSGKVVVTYHDEPEAVILSVQEYATITSALHEAAKRTEPALDALRQRFETHRNGPSHCWRLRYRFRRSERYLQAGFASALHNQVRRKNRATNANWIPRAGLRQRKIVLFRFPSPISNNPSTSCRTR